MRTDLVVICKEGLNVLSDGHTHVFPWDKLSFVEFEGEDLCVGVRGFERRPHVYRFPISEADKTSLTEDVEDVLSALETLNDLMGVDYEV